MRLLIFALLVVFCAFWWCLMKSSGDTDKKGKHDEDETIVNVNEHASLHVIIDRQIIDDYKKCCEEFNKSKGIMGYDCRKCSLNTGKQFDVSLCELNKIDEKLKKIIEKEKINEIKPSSTESIM